MRSWDDFNESHPDIMCGLSLRLHHMLPHTVRMVLDIASPNRYSLCGHMHLCMHAHMHMCTNINRLGSGDCHSNRASKARRRV